MTKADDERRFAHRVKRWFPVEVRAAGRRRMAVGRDASATGVLLAATSRFDVGEEVSLRCKLDDETIERVQGRVVRYEIDDALDVFPHRVAIEIDRPARWFEPGLELAESA